MIRIQDPMTLGVALGNIRAMLGLSRAEFARQIAKATGRNFQTVNNQLCEWENGGCGLYTRSLGPILTALGYDLALVPREDA